MVAGHPRRRASAVRVSFVSLVVVALALSVLLAACGSNGSLDTGSSGGAEQPDDTSDLLAEPVEREPTDEADLPDRPASGEIAAVTSAEARALRDSDRNAVFIDARDQRSYMASHLVGAQHIDVGDQELWERRVGALDGERPTVVYCDTAECSAEAAVKLVGLGFTEVYDLGAVGDWAEGDLPLDR